MSPQDLDRGAAREREAEYRTDSHSETSLVRSWTVSTVVEQQASGFVPTGVSGNIIRRIPKNLRFLTYSPGKGRGKGRFVVEVRSPLIDSTKKRTSDSDPVETNLRSPGGQPVSPSRVDTLGPTSQTCGPLVCPRPLANDGPTNTVTVTYGWGSTSPQELSPGRRRRRGPPEGSGYTPGRWEGRTEGPVVWLGSDVLFRGQSRIGHRGRSG